MNIADIKKVLASLSQSSVRELRIRKPGFSLVLRRNSVVATRLPESVPATASSQASTSTRVSAQSGGVTRDSVQAPYAGIFYGRHPACRELTGDRSIVKTSEIIGFIANGVVLLPVSPPRDGVLVDQITPDGSVVGYGADVYVLQGEGT